MVFNLERTKELLAREAPRYREAIMSGLALRRLPDNEAMFVLGNANLFDDELRASLTGQLTSMAAITSFAVVTVPPGFVSDRNAMNQFVDGDLVLERLATLKTSEGMPNDPWLNRSVMRLEATLKGKDPDRRELQTIVGDDQEDGQDDEQGLAT